MLLKRILFFVLSVSVIAQGELLPSEPLGLQREGLVYTLTAGFFDHFNLTNVDEDYDDIIKVDISQSKISESTQILRPGLTRGCLRHELNCFKNKNLVYYLTYRLQPLLMRQQPRHLVFVVPGFGGRNDSGLSEYLIEVLSSWGLAVAVFDSPASKRFITETSQYGVPGIQILDADELYQGMVLARKELEQKVGAHFKYDKVSIIGTSLGGLNAQLIQLIQLIQQKERETKEKETKSTQLDFFRVISVNPPLQNKYGLTLIDQMISDYFKRPIVNSFNGLKSLLGYIPISFSSFDELNEFALSLQTSNITVPEARHLIGMSFYETVRGALDGYRLRYPLVADKKMYSQIVTFHDLFNQITIPHLQKNNKLIVDKRLSELMKIINSSSRFQLDGRLLNRDSILQNYAALNLSEGYRVMTFDDDFLVNQEDLEFMQVSMNKKIHVYTGGGGHLGGLYRADFQKDLKNELLAD